MFTDTTLLDVLRVRELEFDNETIVEKEDLSDGLSEMTWVIDGGRVPVSIVVPDTLCSLDVDRDMNNRVTVRLVAVKCREMLDVLCDEGESDVVRLLRRDEALDVLLGDAVNIRDSVIVGLYAGDPVADAYGTLTLRDGATDAL
jgi:hypothetical protein